MLDIYKIRTIILDMLNILSNELPQLARMCRALGSEARLSLLAELIACCGEDSFEVDGQELEACSSGANVGSLCESSGLAPSTISHHVKELREAGLIRTERQGKQAICHADLSQLRRLGAILGGLGGSRVSRKSQQSCCVVVKPVKESVNLR